MGGRKELPVHRQAQWLRTRHFECDRDGMDNSCVRRIPGYKVIEEKLNKIIDEERIHSFAPWDRIPVLHSLFR